MDHETPSTEIFNEIVNATIQFWKTKSNVGGYADDKIKVVKAIQNYQDNVMKCYRMLDYGNQFQLRSMLSKEAIQYINQNR